MGLLERISESIRKKQENKHFNEERGKYFPPAQTGEGIISNYCPTEKERTNCGYAPPNYECSKIKTGSMGGTAHMILCAECAYHPRNARY